MLEKDITVDDESQYFEIPRNHNHSDTASRSDTNMFDKVLVEPDTLQCQKHTTNFMQHQKLPPYGKEYLCFQTYGITA